MQSETIQLASELVRAPSVTPNDAGCQKIIGERLLPLGFSIENMDHRDVQNIWARKGTEPPLLVFVGHTDVVPAGNEAEWTYPPFSATVANGYLHGRGAADMKGSIAAMVTACERLFSTATSKKINGSLAFLITSDEEAVAIDGTRHVLGRLNNRSEVIDACLVGEPTCELNLGDTIKIGRRGSLDGNITVFGKQGHVAYPHLAENPIHKCGQLISDLAALDWGDSSENFPATTFQISNIQSGVGANNVIPGQLSMKFNLRFSPATSVDAIIEKIEGVCRDLGLKFDADWGAASNPYYTEPAEFVEIVSRTIEDKLGIKPDISTAGGTSDGRFVATTGAPVVEFGPLNSTIHKVNERVQTESLNKLSSVYEEIVRNYLCIEN